MSNVFLCGWGSGGGRDWWFGGGVLANTRPEGADIDIQNETGVYSASLDQCRREPYFEEQLYYHYWLIKLRATRIIQLCDLQTVLTAHCTTQILSKQYCNDTLLIGDVVMSTALVWPLTSITSKAFQLLPDITYCFLKDVFLLQCLWKTFLTNLVLKGGLPNRSSKKIV